MENKKEDLNVLKEALRKEMISLFKKDGCLEPMLIYYRREKSTVENIPDDLFSDPTGKRQLAETIRRKCQDPSILAVCLICEAYRVLTEKESKLSKLLLTSNIRVSELKQKQDTIMMIFGTPEGEELISYFVDCKNKRVFELYTPGSKKLQGGIFFNLFDKAA